MHEIYIIRTVVGVDLLLLYVYDFEETIYIFNHVQ